MKPKFLLAFLLFLLAGHVGFAATGPTITTFSPASGAVGTLITVTGTNLGNPTVFSVGGVQALVLSGSATQIQAQVMVGTVTGPLSITTSGGSVNSSSNFTVIPTAAKEVTFQNFIGIGGESVGLNANGNTAVVSKGNTAYVFQHTGPFIYQNTNYTYQGNTALANNEYALEVDTGALTGNVAISADGNTVVASGYEPSNGNSGGCYVFVRNGNSWAQQGPMLLASGASNSSLQEGGGGLGAIAISADGNTILLSALEDSQFTGATWVFTRSGTTWTQQAKLVGTGATQYAAQGESVALSANGNTVLIGGPGDNGGNFNYSQGGIGAAWVFTRTGTTWTQQGAKLVGSNAIGDAQIGQSVALSADGNTALMGGEGDNNSQGATWVFTRTGGTWTQQGNKLIGSGVAFFASQGQSVALSAVGNTAFIGGPNDNNNAGAIWEFTRTGGVWTQLGAKLPGRSSGGERLGTPIGVSADATILFAGVPSFNNNIGGIAFYSAALPADTTLAATIITTTGATLNGTVDANGDSTTVIMQYSKTPDLSNAITAALSSGTTPIPTNTTAGNVSFTSVLTGLAPGTTYYFRIVATDSYGTQNGTILSFKTTAAPPPPADTTLAATNISYNGATLNGKVNDKGVSTTVKMRYSLAADMSNPVNAPLTTGLNPLPAGTGTTAYTSVLTGLAASTTYYFQIYANNVNGTIYGDTLSFTTPVQPMITFVSPINTVYGDTVTASITSTDPGSPILYRFVTPGIVESTTGTSFHAIGVGSTSIVAYQYAPGTNNIEASASGTITVIPAPLTIKADNETIVWNQPAPAFTATYTGLVNGDTPANLPANASPVLSTSYVAGSAAGGYNIINSPRGTGTGGNYNITYTNGILTVTQLYPKPVATTVAATNITATGATINGIVGTNQGPSTTVTLQYTDNDSDGLQGLITATLTTGSSPLAPNAGDTNFAAILTGLKPGTTYYFIINGINPEFTTTGDILTFTTPAASLPQGVITFNPLNNEVYGSADVAPGATSTNTADTIHYASSNTAVAVMVNGKIHIIGAGTTMITASQAGNATYSAATPVTQTFTVTPAPLTITANSPTSAYGAMLPALTVSYNSFVNGDSPASLTTPPTVTTMAKMGSGADTYAVTASGAADPNYTITYVAGTATITSAPLTITASSPTSIYGSAIPPLTVSYKGFVNNDSPDSLTTRPTATTTAQTGAGAGSYPTTASGAVDRNYTITYVAGSLTITPAPLTITANDQTRLYGAANPTFTLTYTTFVNNDTQGSLTTQPVIATTATITSPAGPYPITVSGAVDANYTITYADGRLTVNAAVPVAITQAATAISNSGATLNGTVNDDGASTTVKLQYGQQADLSDAVTAVLSSGVSPVPPGNGVTSFSSVLTGLTPGVTYYFRISGTNSAGTANGNILSFTSATILAQSITFPAPASEVYGSPDVPSGAVSTNSTIPITYTSSNTAVATVSASGSIHIISVGSTNITASQAGNTSYSAATPVTQTFTVTPAALTITADDLSKPYGAADPVFTFTYSGFVYSDKASNLSSLPMASTTAVTTSDAGTYPITVNGAASSNYTITYMDGTLTVVQAKQTIDFAGIPQQLINADYELKNVISSSGLPVVLTLSDPMLATLAGTTLTSLHPGIESVTASQAGNANYLPAASVVQTYTILDDNGDDIVVNPVVSPNGDGIDDVLNIKNIENYPDNHLVLVNRNGVKIFEINNYNNVTRVFDGHSSITGAFQQQGTLLYVLEYMVKGQVHRKTGFTVLRY